MFDHGGRPVELVDGGDGHRGDTRPGPDEGGLAFDVDGDGLAACGEVDADADCFLPAVAVEPVVGQAPDDSAGR